MSGEPVKLAYVILFLVIYLQTGESLKCYESSCLKDHSQKPLRCRDDATEMTLEECTPSSFTQRWSDVTREGLSTTEMKCVKLEGKGHLPKVATGLDVIRMCSPQTQNMCEILSSLVSTKIQHSEVVDLRLPFSCSICDTDGCNSAPSHTIPLFLLFVTAGILAFVTL